MRASPANTGEKSLNYAGETDLCEKKVELDSALGLKHSLHRQNLVTVFNKTHGVCIYLFSFGVSGVDRS